VGVWSGPDEIAAMWREERRFEPAMRDEERSARLEEWSRALDRAREWVQP
jgi:glycerol kinase